MRAKNLNLEVRLFYNTKLNVSLYSHSAQNEPKPCLKMVLFLVGRGRFTTVFKFFVLMDKESDERVI
jgi:hypothetical protein